MFFQNKNKGYYSLIDTFEEPCFLFGSKGQFKHANVAATALLDQISLAQNNLLQNYDGFTEILRYAGKENESGILKFLDKKYSLNKTTFQTMRLLRLLPVKEDENMLRLSTSLEIMPWGLITVDLSAHDTPILYCNVRAAKFLNMLQADLNGIPIRDVFRLMGVEHQLMPLLEEQAPCVKEHEYTREDRQYCCLRFHFIPYEIKTRHALLVVEDITQEKIRETQHFQAQRLEALGQLSGGVAHDFNNILSIIDGYARMARKEVASNSQAYTYMEHVSNAVKRGASLTSQLLTFGRHKVVKEKVVDLGQLVLEQEALIRPLMDASIALAFNIEENIRVEVPPDDICQILLNLCVNARDAMPDGGNLIIEVRKTNDNQALLEVMDSGSGMSPDVKLRIFDPFFTTKDQGKGSGLGLSMVYGLVKDMGGAIDVNSRPGHGCIFSIYIPISDKELAVHTLEETDDGNIRLNGFTALIAEDEPDLLHLVSGMMEEMGANVLRASNGNEALQIQDDYDGDIDFLLTDVVMPELNGIRLAELFSAVRPDSKILFMSGYPANGQMSRIKVPDDAFLMPKPINYEKLCAIVRSMARSQNDNQKEKLQAMIGQWRSA